MDARFKGCPVRPESTLEFAVPIGSILVNDFLEDSLENLVGGLGQAVRLWVVRRAFLVHDRIVVCQLPDDMVDEVPPLVADELDWASVTAPQVFIYKFRRRCGRVISEGLGLNPLVQ